MKSKNNWKKKENSNNKKKALNVFVLYKAKKMFLEPQKK